MSSVSQWRRAYSRRVLVLVGLGSLGGFAGLGTSGLAGATSTNGIASKPGSQIVQTALKNTAAVRSVSFDLTGTSHGEPITVEGTAGQRAGAATITLGEGTINVALVHKTVYFKGDQSFYQQQGASNAKAAQLAGQWVSAPSSDSQFNEFDQFLLAKSLFIQAGQGVTGTGIRYTKLGNATIDGTSTIKVSVDGPKKTNDDGIVYVSTTGTPYLIRARQTGAQGDAVTLSNFNEPVNVEIPRGVVAVS